MFHLSIPPLSQQRSLTGIIAQSAQQTGVDFQYLVAQAQLESGLRPDAKAATSSATGLYQFIDQTWMGLIKEKGDQYGLGWAEKAISRNRNGQFSIADKSQKNAILALRNDAQLSANMAGEFASDNKAYLEDRIGREPESVDLYLAHFLGPAGAAKFLNHLDASPQGAAASHFQSAARANRSIFFNRHGEAHSFESIRDRFEQKLADAVTLVGSGNGLPTNGNMLPSSDGAARMVQPEDYLRIAQAHARDHETTTQSKPFSEPARAAYLMLATLGM
ncbi:MAG: transglycosylase SLT domain-containing protein [Parasphingorhabdus sp.]|uniref:transglycosylase SLT domain-containing protein n=1 Tax=Parasphingorhabdus sp. TaxID=2709688 RepID=UPI0032996525